MLKAAFGIRVSPRPAPTPDPSDPPGVYSPAGGQVAAINNKRPNPRRPSPQIRLTHRESTVQLGDRWMPFLSCQLLS